MALLSLILGILAILQGLVALFDGIRSARHMRTFRPRRVAGERVMVFCPCKGIDSGFEKNIRSILDQDYPHFDVTFIVDSIDDPAYGALTGLGVPRILVAGHATTRGQKVHNLAYAIEQTDTSAATVFVFCDSDARFPREWLSRLLAPLNADNITTGYRWYATPRFHLQTLLRSAWNASSVSVLGDHNRNFAWGGSTAIHQETFNRLKILDAWRGSVSDDYSVTRAAERGRVRIVFIPECLIPSYGECTWSELFEFTTRQIIITRVYHPRLWGIGFAGHLIFTAAFFILPLTHPILWFALYGISAVRSWIRYRAIGTVLPRPALSNYGWFYILCSPLVALLYLYNMTCAAFSREIVWRQIHYRLVSPHETRVFGGSAASES